MQDYRLIRQSRGLMLSMDGSGVSFTMHSREDETRAALNVALQAFPELKECIDAGDADS
jgi:hypothetical protein